MLKIDTKSMDSGTLNFYFRVLVYSNLSFLIHVSLKKVLVIAIINFVYMENQFINPK